MTTLYMTKRDLLPAVQATLKYLDGTLVDLTTATGVVFNMAKEDGTVVINAAAGAIISPSGGIVKYSWTGDDTDVQGVCYAEFIVSFSGGTGVLIDPKLSFPAKGDFEIRFRNRIVASA